MREIKFMGKPVDGGDWVYGYYFKIRDMCFIASYDEHASALTWHVVIPKSVGQFTGQKDKNGVESYSGNIIQAYSAGLKICEPLVIKYSGTSFTMASRHDREEGDISWYFDFEIIGNSTDNPELLA